MPCWLDPYYLFDLQVLRMLVEQNTVQNGQVHFLLAQRFSSPCPYGTFLSITCPWWGLQNLSFCYTWKIELKMLVGNSQCTISSICCDKHKQDAGKCVMLNRFSYGVNTSVALVIFIIRREPNQKWLGSPTIKIASSQQWRKRCNAEFWLWWNPFWLIYQMIYYSWVSCFYKPLGLYSLELYTMKLEIYLDYVFCQKKVSSSNSLILTAVIFELYALSLSLSVDLCAFVCLFILDSFFSFFYLSIICNNQDHVSSRLVSFDVSYVHYSLFFKYLLFK